IIFSFWTTTLDLAGSALASIQTPFVRFDGTVPRSERQQALHRFMTDHSMRTILISLRCGANGLNLTAANHVFLMEPQWNPALEDQALDRVHRIGQTKAVTTVRYIMNNSIEESIQRQQSDKRTLAEQAFSLSTKKEDWAKMLKTMLLKGQLSLITRTLMAPLPPLFTLPIPSTKGSITCTQPFPLIYLLTFSSQPDNRFTPSFCATFLLALDIIDRRYKKGIVITTSGIPKFYSNGLDYEAAVKTKGFFEESLYPLWRRLLTYPMPTLALLNGHAFAAGLMTAMMHDYRFMNPHRGYLCLNELEFGAPLQPPMSSIFRQKIPSPNTYRTLVLEAKRFSALEALEGGMVDGLGDLDDVVKFVREIKLVQMGRSGVYGRLKGEMWRETVGFLDAGAGEEEVGKREKEEQKKREENEERRVVEWERSRRERGSKL
ncbi:MAG: hypothetical protein Q9181_008122, partial [Wetmoreana brouardii]